jgi:hypothetical protein
MGASIHLRQVALSAAVVSWAAYPVSTDSAPGLEICPVQSHRGPNPTTHRPRTRVPPRACRHSAPDKCGPGDRLATSPMGG